jgi:FtsH-binding integral membrane protein
MLFFIPFLPSVLRKSLSYTLGLSSFLFALNNFSLIFFRNAFLVDKIGYTPTIFVFILCFFILLVYYIWKEKRKKQEIYSTIGMLLIYLILVGLFSYYF